MRICYDYFMQKKHIITLGGKPGSGKSSTAKGLAQYFSYDRFSSGDLFRALGEERGLDILAANLTAEQNAEIDHLVDQRLRDIGVEQNNLVIDSRMAWHWMPQSFKVFLDLGIEVAAKRIVSAMDPARLESEHIPTDPHEYAVILQERLDSETRRYQNLYQVDPYQTHNYDLVVDTEANSLEEVIKIVAAAYEQWLVT